MIQDYGRGREGSRLAKLFQVQPLRIRVEVLLRFSRTIKRIEGCLTYLFCLSENLASVIATENLFPVNEGEGMKRERRCPE